MSGRISQTLLPTVALTAVLLSLIGAVGQPPKSIADEGGRRSAIVGAWDNVTTRSGSGASNAVLTFHEDGTMDYIASSNINSPALLGIAGTQFNSRSGGRGEYVRSDRCARAAGTTIFDTFAGHYEGMTKEILYTDGLKAGTFLVNFKFRIERGADHRDKLVGAFRFRINRYRIVPGVPPASPLNLSPLDLADPEEPVSDSFDDERDGQISGYRVVEDPFFSR